MMTVPGLALFYGGLVRKKNVLSTLMQSFAAPAACFAALGVLWLLAGLQWHGPFHRRHGEVLPRRALRLTALTGTIPELLFMVFQMTFAIITPALICGAFADRMKFSALLWFLCAWLLLVYVPVAHWVWGGGFLAQMGLKDFAGGTVVEINSGVAGLVAAIMLGKRRGFPQEPMVPHNLILSVLGASLLWVGWLAFNGGSALAANATAAFALVNTQIAGAAGALAWMAVEWAAPRQAIGARHHLRCRCRHGGHHAVLWFCRAHGCAGHWPSGRRWAASMPRRLLKRKLGYDDSLDVFGVHGIGGFIGTIGIGVFGSQAFGGAPGLIEGNAALLRHANHGCGDRCGLLRGRDRSSFCSCSKRPWACAWTNRPKSKVSISICMAKWCPDMLGGGHDGLPSLLENQISCRNDPRRVGKPVRWLWALLPQQA